MKTRKKYSEMTTAELRAATKEFDEDYAFEKARPLTANAKRLLATARRRGRPPIGLGAEKIRATVERGLLRQADLFARKNGMTRSEMIARGLRAVMAMAG